MQNPSPLPSRRAFVTACVGALAGAAARPARAADAWPARPIRILVPGGPGGVIDVRARWLAERLAPALGRPVFVENRPGAGGNVGMEVAARSAADGHTLVIVHQGTMTMSPHLYANPGYDALADFAPIARLGIGPLLLAVHPAVRANSLSELIAIAKAKPGTLNYGSPGNGTPPIWPASCSSEPRRSTWSTFRSMAVDRRRRRSSAARSATRSKD